MQSALHRFTRSVEKYLLEVYFEERRGIFASLTRIYLKFNEKIFRIVQRR